jgi:maltose O-acetyltransferase
LPLLFVIRHLMRRLHRVKIGNNVWLGDGVIVCPGVMMGDNTVVGARTVVTRDLPANVLVAGNPARIIRLLGDGKQIMPSMGGRP